MSYELKIIPPFVVGARMLPGNSISFFLVIQSPVPHAQLPITNYYSIFLALKRNYEPIIHDYNPLSVNIF